MIAVFIGAISEQPQVSCAKLGHPHCLRSLPYIRNENTLTLNEVQDNAFAGAVFERMIRLQS